MGRPTTQQPDDVKRRDPVVAFEEVVPGGAAIVARMERVDRLTRLLRGASEGLLTRRVLRPSFDERANDPVDANVILGAADRIARKMEVFHATTMSDAQVRFDVRHEFPLRVRTWIVGVGSLSARLRRWPPLR